MTAAKKKQREKSKKHFEKRSYYRKMWRHLLTITMQILPIVSRSKDDQTVKFDQ